MFFLSVNVCLFFFFFFAVLCEEIKEELVTDGGITGGVNSAWSLTGGTIVVAIGNGGPMAVLYGL